jgi:hypothetical protein
LAVCTASMFYFLPIMYRFSGVLGSRSIAIPPKAPVLKKPVAGTFFLPTPENSCSLLIRKWGQLLGVLYRAFPIV